MKRFLLIAPVLLCGCFGNDTPATRTVLDLDYASTSLGYRNSGALSAGRLLLWDQVEGSLVSLQSDIPLSTRNPTNPVRLEATAVQGVSVSASVNLTEEARTAIASEVRRNVSFVVEDAIRLNSSDVYSGLSDAYRRLNARGVNAFAAWRVEDATGNPNRFRYVLLVDEIQASSESLTYDGGTTSSISFTIVDSVNGEIRIESPSNVTATCSGQSATCYVNARVLRPFINESGNLDYEPTSYNRALLAHALRSM